MTCHKKAPTSAETIDSELNNDLEPEDSTCSIDDKMGSDSSDTDPRSTACTMFAEAYFDRILDGTGKSKEKGKGKMKTVMKTVGQSTRPKAPAKNVTEQIGEEPANTVNTVTYNLTIFPAKEHMKDLKK